MAQKKLKKALQTRKLNSLPSDLKLVAEELIISKFGDEEVVEKKEVRNKSSSSFRQEYTFGIDMGRESVTTTDERFIRASAPADAVLNITRREPGVDRRVDFHSRQSRRYLGYRADRFRGHDYGKYIGELFGVSIFAQPGVHPEIIAQ